MGAPTPAPLPTLFLRHLWLLKRHMSGRDIKHHLCYGFEAPVPKGIKETCLIHQYTVKKIRSGASKDGSLGKGACHVSLVL